MKPSFIVLWILFSLVIPGCFINSQPAPAGVAVVITTENAPSLKRFEGDTEETSTSQWDYASRLWVSVDADDMTEAATAQISTTTEDTEETLDVSLSVDAGKARQVTAILFRMTEDGLESYAPDEPLEIDLAEGENHEAVLVVEALDTGRAEVSLENASDWRLAFDDVETGFRLPSFACLPETEGDNVVTCLGENLPVGRTLRAWLIDPECQESPLGETFTLDEAGQTYRFSGK